MTLQRLSLDDNNNTWEVGVDEVGRGCLLGPVIACAVALPDDTSTAPEWSEIKDSKKLSAKKRHRLHDFITTHAASIGLGITDEATIDKINIFEATMVSMKLALNACLQQLELSKTAVEALIDGPYFRRYESTKFTPFRHRCIPSGDATHLAIACASIVAKHTRDTMIQELAKENPNLEAYEISKNKGYGTAAHMKALRKLGPTEFHRKSFKPCSLWSSEL